MSNNVATVHGRFQPPHLDHLEYIEAALNQTSHLIIGITQPDAAQLIDCPEDPHRSESASNPLSYDERCEAIRRMLLARSISENLFSFVRFPIEQPDNLEKFIGVGTVCFTTIRDEWNVVKIGRLKSLGYDVRVLWNKSDQPGIQGTEIRQMIRENDDGWKSFVHQAVADYLIESGIIERIKKREK
jgi:nicotinamide mononucleotide adenylyltransferase